MRWVLAILFLILSLGSESLRAADPPKDLLWSSVPLEGMTLQLVSPKSKGDSLELRFGKGTMAATSCSGGMCTGPLTIWKIEDNRLKVGYVPTEGDALIEFTGKRLVLRDPKGKLFVYSVVKVAAPN